MQPGDNSLEGGYGELTNVASVQGAPVQANRAPSMPNVGAQPTQYSQPVALSSDQLKIPKGPRTLLRFNKTAIIFSAVALVVIASAGVLTLSLTGFRSNEQLASTTEQPASNYDVSDLSLSGVTPIDQLKGVTQATKLSINGELQVGNTFVVTPTAAPSVPKTGQMYFNKDTKTPYIYNGTEFVSMTDQDVVKSLGGLGGAVAIGAGLQVAGNQLALSNEVQESLGAMVTTVQGQRGNVTFSAGDGIVVNGTTITNTGVLRILGSSGIGIVQNNGVVNISLPQLLGPANNPTFASVNLTNALAVGAGGTNTNGATFSARGVFYFDGTKFVTTNTPASNGLCLLSSASGPVFGACSEAAAAGVSAITGDALDSVSLTGSIVFTNAVTADNGTTKTVTINAASNTAAGLVTTGNQTFAGNKTIDANLTVTGTANATNFIGNGSGVSNVNAARLNGQLADYYLNASNINTGTLSDTYLSANVALKNAPTNTFAGSIVASGISATTLTGDGAAVTNVDAVMLDGQAASYYRNASNINAGTLADARLSANVALLNALSNTFAGDLVATTLTGNGAGVTNVNALQLGGYASGYYLNAANLSAGTLSDSRLSANVAMYNAGTANFTGILQQGGVNVCTAANNCGYLTGASAEGAYVQLQSGSPGTQQTGNFSISGVGRAAALYQGAYQVCDTSGNCSGLGGELTGAGTAGTIAVFTGTGSSLTDSLLSQADTTVSVAGTLDAVNLKGNGLQVTNVNAAQLGGYASSHYLNASNLSTGTLPDGRLSANVPLLNGLTVNFTGTLQQGGNNVCTTANNCGYLTGASAEGAYIQLQTGTPGTAQVGHMNISGTAIAANFAGNGAALTDVDAVTLGGNDSTYYRNATNLSSGTLHDARLSANVALLNGALINFTGTLQQGGNNVCTTANNCGYLTGASAAGAYVQLQTGTPGTAQVGHLNIDGTAIAASFSGNGAALTNVNAITLGGNDSTYYRNATNLNAGTLADARLSTNVALLTATTANFTGTLQQGGVNVCTADNNCGYLTGASAEGSYVQLQSVTPGTAQTGHFNITGTGRAAALYQGANQVCDTSGNCTGLGNEVTGSGTANTIAMFTGSGAIGNSILTQGAGAITVAGVLNATSLNGNGAGVTNVNAIQLEGQTGAYYRNASNINAGALADARLSSNVALLNGALINFTGTLQQGGNAVCTTANNCNYLTGTSADGSYVQLQSATPGTAQAGHFNITGTGRAAALYQGANQVCDTSGNCTGIGGEITGSGTSGTIAMFTGTGDSLTDSILIQSAPTTLTVGGTLAATTLSGNGAAITDVNAALLGGQASGYYLNASNISTGTLSDDRLSANVALLGATTVNFTGALQRAGNTVCDNSNNCSYLTAIVANDKYIQLQATTPGAVQTGNFNISGTGRAAALYQGANQVCDTGGNCVGLGNGLTGTGTPGAIAKFTGTGSLGNSIMTESATTLTVAGTLAATNLSGNGSAVNSVNAVALGGNNSAFYRDASNLNAGTVADERLTSNVAFLNAANTFTANNTFSTSVTTPLIQSSAALAITAGTSLSLQSSGTSAVSLDSAMTGGVNIGTGANQKTITIGNTTFATAVNVRAGTGGIAIGNDGIANTIQIGNTTGAVAQTINIGNNATLSSSTAITLGSTIGTSAVTFQSGTSGLLVKGANSATAFSIQNATATNLFVANTTSNVVGIGAAPSAAGATLQVTGSQTLTGDLTLSGRLYAGQSGINVYNGSSSSDILFGAGGNVTLQKVTIATNNTVKVGSAMGILYTDGSGNLQVLSVSGQSGNCVGYNGTTVTWSGCSGTGGGGTGFSNGGNAYTTNPGTATSRFNATYDATITNPVLGLQGANALDIVTNNLSRIRIGETGDVAVLSNGPVSSAESVTKFTVRTYNDGNVEQYINTLVVDTSAHGSEYGGRVGIGLKVATAPQVTLDIGGGRNDFGGSGIQVRASAAPGLSISGTQGEGTASTGRIYYDQTLRKFRVSENGGAWTDLVVGGGANPFILGGNAMNGSEAILGTTDSSTLRIRQNGSDRIVMDQGGNINLTPGSNYSVNVAGASTQSGVALNVNGRILANEYATGGYVGITTTNPCNSNQTLNGVRVVAGLVVSGVCATNNSDIAEAYNSGDNLVAGEIVMSAGTAATSVSRATAAGAEKLMGIVSTAPSKTIGTEQVPNGYPIALVGRVPTKVNGEGGAIAIGDKITISSVPGVGKKATGAGMIVGTAVESFNGVGQGTIEVFVHLDYYQPSQLETLQAQTGNFGDLNVSGTAVINNLTVTGIATVHNLVVTGHIITASGQPTDQVQAAAGAGATVAINGNDTTGTITITTGTAPTSGEMAKIVFSELYGKAPHVVLSPSDANAADARYFKGTTTTDGFMLNFKDAPAANTSYSFDYFISE